MTKNFKEYMGFVRVIKFIKHNENKIKRHVTIDWKACKELKYNQKQLTNVLIL